MKPTVQNICPRLFLAALTAFCFCAAGLSAARTADAQERGSFTAHDYKFVCAANGAGAKEIALGHIASEKSDASQAVRDFGQHMVQDHQKLADQLSQLVTQKGAQLPQSKDDKIQKEVMRMQGLTGADFDKAFAGCMVKDHKEAVKLFEKESNKGDDADLKALAAGALPTLQEHLQMAQGLPTTPAGQ